MKLSRLFMLICFLPLSALANLSDCDVDAKDQGANYLQCTYLTGLNENNMSDGRYLKIEIQHNNLSWTEVKCVNNTMTLAIFPNAAQNALGIINENFSICTDDTGKNCQRIKNNSISITKINGEYVANPKLIEISLAPFASIYPKCDAAHIITTQMK